MSSARGQYAGCTGWGQRVVVGWCRALVGCHAGPARFCGASRRRRSDGGWCRGRRGRGVGSAAAPGSSSGGRWHRHSWKARVGEGRVDVAELQRVGGALEADDGAQGPARGGRRRRAGSCRGAGGRRATRARSRRRAAVTRVRSSTSAAKVGHMLRFPFHAATPSRSCPRGQRGASPVDFGPARRDCGRAGPLSPVGDPAGLRDSAGRANMFSRAHYWMLALTEQLSKLLAVTERRAAVLAGSEQLSKLLTAGEASNSAENRYLSGAGRGSFAGVGRRSSLSPAPAARRRCSGRVRPRATRVDVGAPPPPRTSDGARLAASDPRASDASSASVNPWSTRAVAYWSARREPKISGSSAPSATRAPASTRVRSGTSSATS